MLRALLTGIIAGYGIAIPVGAIAVLIVETGMRCGFRCAAVAGAGAATADLLYAALAALGGTAIASAVGAYATPFKWGSAAVLALLAFNGLRRARVGRAAPAGEVPAPDRAELARTYGKFLGLTIINPLTVVYFTVFVVGLGIADTLRPLQAIVFVAGAFAASLSWQTLLAGIGATARRRLPAGFRVGATIVGNLIVLAFAAVVVLR
jgi:threonine/homoserine/homoserine lactone efflux protein